MRTRCFAIRSVVAALAIVTADRPAFAQTDLSTIAPGPRRVDLSGSSGFLLSTDWSNLVLLGSVSTVSGALEQVLVRDLFVEPGPVFDGAVTYWEGRYGFRAHAGLARSCLAVGRNCNDVIGLPGAADSVDVDTWMYDIGGAIGLVDYARGTRVWPYVFLGVGAVTYNIERTISPPLTFIERRPPRPAEAQAAIISRDDPDQLLISIDELGVETRFALNVGVGTDFRIPLGPGGIGLRFELSDHIHRSPVEVLVTNIEAFGGTRRETPVDFGFVHNLRAAA
ncbi:MAG: hypothetical protein ACRDFA_04135, partial [bacterium]